MIAASNASFAQSTNTASLFLFINGAGRVTPLTNGQPLEVGQRYNMLATPDKGYLFGTWQPVNVFTFTSFVVDTNGDTIPVVSTTTSLQPIYTNQPSLSFIMQPVAVISDIPGIRTITETKGWQANFEPISLNIQLDHAKVILSWATNLTSFTLQTTTNLTSPTWTRLLPAPVVVGGQFTVTNTVSGSRRFFRLSKP